MPMLALTCDVVAAEVIGAMKVPSSSRATRRPAVASATSGQQHDELVAAQPRDDVGRRARRRQAPRDLTAAVALGVAQRVVDRLEAVEVDHQQPELRAAGPRRAIAWPSVREKVARLVSPVSRSCDDT